MGRLVRSERIVSSTNNQGMEERYADNYLTRVAKYVPSEILAIYLAAVGALSSLSALSNPKVPFTHAVVLLALLGLTPVYIRRLVKDAGANQTERNTNAAVATCAFLVWSTAIGGPLFEQWLSAIESYQASIVLIIFSAFSGLVKPRKETGGNSIAPAKEEPMLRVLDLANDSRVRSSCETRWDSNKNDCSKFVNAVAGDFQISLSGNADSIVEQIAGNEWTQLADGIQARTKAEAGELVVGGLKGQDHDPPNNHGHVVIVVGGDLAHAKYPHAYWGSLNSVGMKDSTLNYSWKSGDRDKVKYSSRPI